MFNAKKPTYLLLLILMLFLLCSCGKESLSVTNTSPGTDTSISEAAFMPKGTDIIGGMDYAAGKRLCFLEQNRLQIDTVSETSGADYYYVVSKVSGLMDKEIEAAVNDRIAEVAKTWCGMRPVPEGELAETMSEDVIKNACYGASSFITLNSSDYLSGVIARTVDFYDTETLTHSLLTYDYPLNFDLRTGEELSLASLFCSGFDYMSVINSGILSHAKKNALPMKDFDGIPEDSVFSLGEDGVIIYIDDNCENYGMPVGTAITIDYSAFGDSLVIERPCGDIYTEKEKAGFKLIRSTEDSNASSETAFFDEGDKLSVKVTHTAPAGFPETLFEAADNYIKEYIPDETAAAKIRESETDSLRISCDIRGYYIGAYRCVTLNAAIKKSTDVPITSARSYVYDEAGTEVEIGSCFAEDFDINTYVSGILAASVNGLMEDGWTIEEEVDITDIDFFLESDSVTFSTLPARMSRKVTAADGTEQSETHKDSITAKASFDEIGAANLTIAAQ